jgi:type VI secretion system protein ImpA
MAEMIDLEACLQPISSDSPSGENLEYDAAFGELERACIGKPEQEYGSKVIPAEEPNWREAQSRARELIERTKDFRVAVPLARIDLALGRLIDFSKDLELIAGYVEHFWESVHPQLDPDDGNDPIVRVNILESLCDPTSTLNLLQAIPLVSSRVVGRFSLKDVRIANGEISPQAGVTEPADWSKIHAAFADPDVSNEEVTSNCEAAQAAIELLSSIEKQISGYVGSGSGVNFKPLIHDLKAIVKVYTEQLAKRGVVGQDGEPAVAGSAAEMTDSPGGTLGGTQRLSGQITSRDDVIAALDKVCDYYSQYEPSSPLPLLIQRCKRLVPANFLEIVRDILPDSLPQAEAIRGFMEPQ